jgi:hypothetical protein
MYMTKKEKKAIFEAMQQIRNNQRPTSRLNEMFGGRSYSFQMDNSMRGSFENAMIQSGEVYYNFVDNNRNKHQVIFAMDESEMQEVFDVSLRGPNENVDHKGIMNTMLEIMDDFVGQHDAMAEPDSPETQLRGLNVTFPDQGFGRHTGMLRRFAGRNGFRVGGARKHRSAVDGKEMVTIFLQRR